MAANNASEVKEALDPNLSQTGVGANVDYRIGAGLTGLMQAAMLGRPAVARMLLDAHASVDEVSEDGSTALIYAAQHGHGQIVGMLTSPRLCAVKKADPKCVRNCRRVRVDRSCVPRRVAKLDVQDKRGETALTEAVLNGHGGIARTLALKKADVNLRDRKGRTALMDAADQGHWRIVETLLNFKALVDLQDDEGRTAIMMAGANQKIRTLEVLLHKGKPDLALKDKTNSTVLEHPVRITYLDLCCKVLKRSLLLTHQCEIFEQGGAVKHALAAEADCRLKHFPTCQHMRVYYAGVDTEQAQATWAREGARAATKLASEAGSKGSSDAAAKAAEKEL